MLDYLWTHALMSDEANAGIKRYCDDAVNLSNISEKCYQYVDQGFTEVGKIDIYNIYAPLCERTTQKLQSTASVSLLIHLTKICSIQLSKLDKMYPAILVN